MLTSSGSTVGRGGGRGGGRSGGGRGGDAKTIISPNTSFGDIIMIFFKISHKKTRLGLSISPELFCLKIKHERRITCTCGEKYAI